MFYFSPQHTKSISVEMFAAVLNACSASNAAAAVVVVVVVTLWFGKKSP